MNSDVLGGGVMVAVAAILWVAYLMPTWARRRQYLATERNAVRLQQTMRILAETAEVPREVHLEASARTVLTQRKLLAQAEEEARAQARAVSKIAADAAAIARRAALDRARDAVSSAAAAARHSASDSVGSVSRVASRSSSSARSLFRGVEPRVQARRVRQARALSSLGLLVGTVTLVSGVVAVVATGSILVAGIGAGAVVASLGSLTVLARRTSPSAVTVAEQARARRAFTPVHFDEAVPETAASWTPQPLPRPMHLSPGTIAQAAMASADAAAALRRSVADAELARRAGELADAAAADKVTRLNRPAAGTPTRSAAPAVDPAASPFASMGIVGESTPGMNDLDDVLRRRRIAG